MCRMFTSRSILCHLTDYMISVESKFVYLSPVFFKCVPSIFQGRLCVICILQGRLFVTCVLQCRFMSSVYFSVDCLSHVYLKVSHLSAVHFEVDNMLPVYFKVSYVSHVYFKIDYVSSLYVEVDYLSNVFFTCVICILQRRLCFTCMHQADSSTSVLFSTGIFQSKQYVTCIFLRRHMSVVYLHSHQSLHISRTATKTVLELSSY